MAGPRPSAPAARPAARPGPRPRPWFWLLVLLAAAWRGHPWGAQAAAAPARAGAQGAAARQEPSISEGSSRQVTAVLDTLKDILASVENERREESANFQRFEDWCKAETSSLTAGLERERDAQEQSEVEGDELTATVEHLRQAIGDVERSLRETTDVIEQAEAIRSDENERHTEDLQLNQQSIAQVSEAIRIVGAVHTQGGFLQNGALERLQLNEPGESSYVLGIMKGLKDRLEKTREKLETEEAEKQGMHDGLMQTKKSALASFEEEKAQKRQAYTQGRIGLVEQDRLASKAAEQIDELEKLLRQTSDQCSAKQAAWKVRSEDRAKEKAALRQAVNYLEEMMRDQNQATLLLNEGPSSGGAAALLQLSRQRRRGARAPAARARLPSGSRDGQWSLGEEVGLVAPAEFLQIRSTARREQTRAAAAQVRTRSSTKEGAGAGAAATAHRVRKQEPAFDGLLAQLAAGGGGEEAGGDRAREVVTKLLRVSENQQNEEEMKKNYCNSDLERKSDEKSKIDDDVRQLNATVEYKSGEIAKLQNEVVDMETELANMNASFHEAARLRKRERGLFEGGARDRRLAVKVLRQAKQVMNQFYASQDAGTLLQTATRAGAQPSASPPTFGEGSVRKTILGNTVVEMLDKVAADIEEEQREAAAEEAHAARDYEELAVKNKEEFDRLMQEITQRVKRKAKLVVQANTDKEEQVQRTEDLRTVIAQIASLHGECDELLRNFEQRTRARAFEVSQLKDVLDILAGSQVAPRTG